ncbi:kynureninase, partial [Actinomadura adrarensis]
LGLQPKSAARWVNEELEDWARLAVEGHQQARRPWVDYHEHARDPLARLVGALPHEVVAMNSLTVNLHLMMASFYRPSGDRTRIVIEDSAFPSDSYAVESQAIHHGLAPGETVVRLRPRPGEDNLRTEDVLDLLEREGRHVALLLLGGVNYLTGQLMDMPAITKAGRAA